MNENAYAYPYIVCIPMYTNCYTKNPQAKYLMMEALFDS